jgi:hypothetical protein
MASPASALFVSPHVVHRLGIAIRFVDHFTALPIRIPLRVEIESLRWRAFRSEHDATYRFLRTNEDIPSGTFTVTAICPTGEYENREPLSVTLPVVVAHPPPVLANDYLVQSPLWPSRRMRPQAGETVVMGRLLHAGPPPQAPAPDMRVRLFTPALPPPGTPYAYTNANGEFVYRFPGLRMSLSGGVLIDTVTLNIAVRNAADTIGFSPAPPGFAVRLGQTNETSIEIS